MTHTNAPPRAGRSAVLSAGLRGAAQSGEGHLVIGTTTTAIGAGSGGTGMAATEGEPALCQACPCTQMSPPVLTPVVSLEESPVLLAGFPRLQGCLGAHTCILLTHWDSPCCPRPPLIPSSAPSPRDKRESEGLVYSRSLDQEGSPRLPDINKGLLQEAMKVLGTAGSIWEGVPLCSELGLSVNGSGHPRLPPSKGTKLFGTNLPSVSPAPTPALPVAPEPTAPPGWE